MRALLDVNVLVALLDSNHVHHGRARAWLESHAAAGWASCPLTQNGCTRLLSQPRYPNALATSVAMERLRGATSHPSHAFWPADLSFLDPRIIVREHVHGPAQITDLYLLALAVHHEGRLATFDGKIPVSAVRGASAAQLVVI